MYDDASKVYAIVSTVNNVLLHTCNYYLQYHINNLRICLYVPVSYVSSALWKTHSCRWRMSIGVEGRMTYQFIRRANMTQFMRRRNHIEFFVRFKTDRSLKCLQYDPYVYDVVSNALELLVWCHS